MYDSLKSLAALIEHNAVAAYSCMLTNMDFFDSRSSRLASADIDLTRAQYHAYRRQFYSQIRQFGLIVKFNSRSISIGHGTPWAPE